MRAAIYARFSTDRQNESSIIDQVRVCTEYAHRRGWDIAGRFKDEGISGDALGNRPGVQMMIRGSEAREFDALVVMDLHRLARTEDLPPLIKRLKFRGVLVVGVQDGFESTAPTARMQAGLASIMGGEFIEMVKRRTYSALQMRAMDGKPTGGRAYGYRDGEVDRVEAFIVQGDFREVRGWDVGANDSGRPQCSTHPDPGRELETYFATREGLDGLRNPGDRSQRALPRRYSLERQ